MLHGNIAPHGYIMHRPHHYKTQRPAVHPLSVYVANVKKLNDFGFIDGIVEFLDTVVDQCAHDWEFGIHIRRSGNLHKRLSRLQCHVATGIDAIYFYFLIVHNYQFFCEETNVDNFF